MSAPSVSRRLPLLTLLTANAVSNVGNMLTMVAIPWFVLQTTGSASKTGIVAALTALPTIIAGIFGGTIVDRTGFKRMSVLADIASGGAVALIPLLDRTIGIHFWELMLLVFLGALFDAPGSTARQSLLPDLAEPAGMPLERANAAYTGIQRASMLLGPPLAGVLIALFSASNVLLIDAATFAFSAVAIVAIIPSPARQAANEDGSERYLTQLGESFRFVLGDRLIFTMLIIVALVNFITAPLFDVIFPVYARQIYGSALDLGIMMAAFGIGAVIGTLAYGAIGHRVSRRLTFVSAFLLSMIPAWVLVMTPRLAITIAALVVIGIASGPINPLLMTVFQERTPANMRGRLFGMITAIAWVAMPVGMLAAGLLIEYGSLRMTLGLIAGALAFTTLGVLVNPTLRALDKPRTGSDSDADRQTIAEIETAD
ncbi:MAG: MFS transporter [Nitrolancea sp.]